MTAPVMRTAKPVVDFCFMRTLPYAASTSQVMICPVDSLGNLGRWLTGGIG